MTGILKVDTIQKNDGSTPTAADLGLNVTDNIIQVVQSQKITNSVTSSTSFVNTGLSVAITPASTSSKILVHVHAGIDNNNSANSAHYTLYRDSTNVGNGDYGFGRTYAGSSRIITPVALMYLDSPATTSEIVYSYWHRSVNGGQIEAPGSYSTLTITAMEIAG